MNKQELIEVVAKDNGLSKAQVAKVVDCVFCNIVKAVSKGGVFQLVGFGTFKAAKRSARVCRNPQTGEAIKVPATVVPKFSAGAKFKGAVAKKGKKK